MLNLTIELFKVRLLEIKLNFNVIFFYLDQVVEVL